MSEVALAKPSPRLEEARCYHCGNTCDNHVVFHDRKPFCCEGCSKVYQLLDDNQLCDYYRFDENPGRQQLEGDPASSEYLDNASIVRSLLDFSTSGMAKVTFFIPYMHCASCIWLLENLPRLHAGVMHARVDFLKKQVAVTFNPTKISLREVVQVLKNIGYEPLIDIGKALTKGEKSSTGKLLTRLGVAGFCAGNIMLFSFPEYLGLEEPMYRQLFGYLNLVMSIPVVFYSAGEYFDSVRKSLSERKINLDVPILLAILTAFSRSVFEVLTETGAGYFDSLTGLIFLLLAGKWFQQKSFDFLSFERDVNAYFPLSVCKVSQDKETYVPLDHLQKGDKIKIRKNEIVPADCLLYQGKAELDYSFVTGEAVPEQKLPGELLFAGARLLGSAIEAEVVRVAQKSYLTQLWNEAKNLKARKSGIQTFTDAVGTWFTPLVLALAFGVAAFWWPTSVPRAINAFTATLIIACPCALAISYPFAVGHAMRWLSKVGVYLKNADVVERIAQSRLALFDKTGTLTKPGSRGIQYYGTELYTADLQALAVLSQQSTHPLSKQLATFLKPHAKPIKIENYEELTGKGIQALVNGHWVRYGSATMLGIAQPVGHHPKVFVEIDNQSKGYFEFQSGFRPGLADLLEGMKTRLQQVWLLSGDHATEKEALQDIFKEWSGMAFTQKPEDKMQKVKELEPFRPMMFGDGLNDAAALQVAHVGVAITDDTLTFSPGSDVIVEGKNLYRFPAVLDFAKGTMRTIRISFAISLVYNTIGLTFALTGNLSPLVAAVLMPISSVTMMLVSAAGTWWYGRRLVA